MSDSPRTVAKSESGRVLPRKIFDDILAIANSLLEDESPIADFEDWLFPIDDTLLELKLWAKTVGVEQGLLEKVVRYEELCLVVGRILHDVITPLQDIKKMCDNPEILTSPEVRATVSTAVDEFQSSTSILVDSVASTLIDTVELFQGCGAKAKEQSLLHDDKPIGSITDSPYEVNHHNQQVPTCDKTAEGQQKRVSGTPDKETPPRTKTSFKAFLEVLKEMSPQEGQAIRFGELPVLRQQLLMGIHSNQKRGADEVGDDSVYTQDEVIAVAVTLARFHDAWLETFWTTPPTASDVKRKINCVPYVAKIWLILHEIGKEHLLDYFCEGEKTDQSLPLDVLTLETILPPDLIEDASIFARVQFSVVPRLRRLVGSEVRGKRDLAPSDEQYIKRDSNENLAEERIPGEKIGMADYRSSGKVGATESISKAISPTTRIEYFKRPLTSAERLAGIEDVPSNHEVSNSPVNYETQDEKNDSDLQLLWSKVMDKGNYINPSTYKKVEVLLLCWAESWDDLGTKQEVEALKATFETAFNYHATIEYLHMSSEQGLQVRLNAKVAAFVSAHDGPKTLFIVYYAGNGRPGQEYGHLELFGRTPLNDDYQKRLDGIVWNKTEKLLLPAEADVLEILDCCYAGQTGLMTKGKRSVEILAATEEMGTTRVPGRDSFTSALIYALQTLVNERENGRFTTVDLLNKIRSDAPHFPKDQHPILFNRAKMFPTGLILLHPLQNAGLDDTSSRSELAEPEAFTGTTLTLHYDFSEKPSLDYVEMLGKSLNKFFQGHGGINRVRWGGLSQPLSEARLKRQQRAFKEDNRSAAPANTRTTLDLPTPPESSLFSLPTMEPVAKGSPPADILSVLSIGPLDSNDEDEGQIEEPKRRRKRRRTALHGESP